MKSIILCLVLGAPLVSCGDAPQFERVAFGGTVYQLGKSQDIAAAIKTGQIAQGQRVASTFLYSGEFFDDDMCGLLEVDERDYSISKALSNPLAEFSGFLVLCSTEDVKERLSKRCHHTLFGGSCHVALGGVYSGRKKLKLSKGLVRDQEPFVIDAERLTVLEYDSSVGKNDTIRGAIQAAEIYKGLGRSRP
ncbi:MAG TPA: hypothetical protein VFZ91_16745 [Allosphingosinicella sp.]